MIWWSEGTHSSLVCRVLLIRSLSLFLHFPIPSIIRGNEAYLSCPQTAADLQTLAGVGGGGGDIRGTDSLVGI